MGPLVQFCNRNDLSFRLYYNSRKGYRCRITLSYSNVVIASSSGKITIDECVREVLKKVSEKREWK